MPKYIFITGGVVSSVGKGITVASIGRILKSRGISVSVQKLDPYLNVDPGTMNPYQHGEVFVTEDGGETDLDLGHYERFIDINLTKASSVTTGQVYSAVIANERRGDFLGRTIQVIPHITEEIKSRINQVGVESGAEVVIVEVGGTVGDIEGQPFLEAIRQMRRELGSRNAMFIHVTLLPYLSSTGELKTKPTQHSVKELRSMGIQPDVIVCRSDYPVSDDLKNKIALFCGVDQQAVIPLLTVDTVYAVPLVLENAGLGQFVVERLALPATQQDLAEWSVMVDLIERPKARQIHVGIIGKYVDLPDAYISIKEALGHAAVYHNLDVVVHWIDAEALERDGSLDEVLRELHGLIVAPGFGYRGTEGKIKAARYARNKKIPYLGLCLGMQVMVIEFARHILGSDDPNSTEFDEDSRYPVIDLLPEQRAIADKGGTMRLGSYPCKVIPGTRAYSAYQADLVYERHRHRFEFNNDYREMFVGAGLMVSGVSPDGRLVEIVEMRDHPWMLGCQFHPEFKSRPDRPHPLFREYVKACSEFVREGDQRPLPLQAVQQAKAEVGSAVGLP